MVATKKRLPLLFVLLFLYHLSPAQKPQSQHAAGLRQALEKLNVLGSVLYVAAHPDDENTRMIAYLSKEKLYHTAYLSLTRGDGGQNLIGPEIRESLGIIRTQELLAARRIDGGSQYFTRANDFGYSKTSKETLNIWERDKILADVVWVIRKFRPDVVITRFNTEDGRTHGHHTASAILAREAFHAAANPEKFPRQLEYVEPWQPKKLMWNTSWWFFRNRDDFDTTNLMRVNVGGYNSLLGKSYTEIAAEARSMHRSQGFGASTSRGDAIEYLEPTLGPSGEFIFDGIDVTWDRVAGGSRIEESINKIIENFDPVNPAASVPALLETRAMILSLKDPYWKEIKLKEIDQVIYGCLGLFLEAVTHQYTATGGDSLSVHVEAINRSQTPVRLKGVRFSCTQKDTALNENLAFNKELTFSTGIVIPETTPISQPYWLKKDGSEGLFHVDDQRLIGLPENEPTIRAHFDLVIDGHEVTYAKTVAYKEVDPAIGEVYKPLQITPPVFTRLDKPVYIFSENAAQHIHVAVKAGRPNLQAAVSVRAPAGWQITPAQASVNLSFKGEEQLVSFKLTPPSTPSSGKISANATVGETTYSYSLVNIDYDHIPSQVWFPEASSQVVRVDLQKRGELIGYVPGAGDAIPESLELIGYRVEILSDQDFNNNLQKYDAIILGVRAYNTNDRIRYYQQKLFDYAAKGGVVITQYNTTGGLLTNELAPYPLSLSRERVSVETAPVKILAPDHPAMNYPNPISVRDFEGWVQERGLYFPNEWSDAYTAPIETSDPGEDPKAGGLLIARHGKGYYVYTGFSWFRQLPAGVPGAYRIFANLISLGKFPD